MAWPLSAVDAFGIVGLVLLLAGFLGNLVKRLPPDGAAYGWLNFSGSGILAVYSVAIEAWVFFPLEVVWAGAAGFALLQRALKQRRGGAASLP